MGSSLDFSRTLVVSGILPPTSDESLSPSVAILHTPEVEARMKEIGGTRSVCRTGGPPRARTGPDSRERYTCVEVTCPTLSLSEGERIEGPKTLPGGNRPPLCFSTLFGVVSHSREESSRPPRRVR